MSASSVYIDMERNSFNIKVELHIRRHLPMRFFLGLFSPKSSQSYSAPWGAKKSIDYSTTRGETQCRCFNVSVPTNNHKASIKGRLFSGR